MLSKQYRLRRQGRSAPSAGDVRPHLQQCMVGIVGPPSIKDQLILVSPWQERPLRVMRLSACVPRQIDTLAPPHIQPGCLSDRSPTTFALPKGPTTEQLDSRNSMEQSKVSTGCTRPMLQAPRCTMCVSPQLWSLDAGAALRWLQAATARHIAGRMLPHELRTALGCMAELSTAVGRHPAARVATMSKLGHGREKG